MRNRRLIVLMSILTFIVIVIVLSSTVFSLKSAELNFLSTTNLLEDNETIVESANFDYGESIFLIDKQEYINELEVNNPYLRVVGLEMLFPSKLVIHAVERNEFYAFKLSNNTYAICDEFLKVLELKPVFINNNENGIVVLNTQNQIMPEQAELGTILDLPTSYANVLKNFAHNSQEWDNNIATLRGNVESLEIAYEASSQNNNYDDLLIIMRQGLRIVVRDANVNLSEKLVTAYSTYDSGEIDVTTGEIEIIQETDGSISAFSPSV